MSNKAVSVGLEATEPLSPCCWSKSLDSTCRAAAVSSSLVDRGVASLAATRAWKTARDSADVKLLNVFAPEKAIACVCVRENVVDTVCKKKKKEKSCRGIRFLFPPLEQFSIFRGKMSLICATDRWLQWNMSLGRTQHGLCWSVLSVYFLIFSWPDRWRYVTPPPLHLVLSRTVTAASPSVSTQGPTHLPLHLRLENSSRAANQT